VLLRAATIIATVILSAGIGLAPPTTAGTDCPDGEYRGSSGDCVPRPTAGSRPTCATAICNDGDYSCSEHPHASGTCRSHGGVSQYL
jgi:hypothetical protein